MTNSCIDLLFSLIDVPKTSNPNKSLKEIIKETISEEKVVNEKTRNETSKSTNVIQKDTEIEVIDIESDTDTEDEVVNGSDYAWFFKCTFCPANYR